ncbi:2Fe-2S iron-sulfur cluster-binding protein [Alcanivorax sp. DP30]|uniref:2Fe-2S iron-sulfur cluster-binding protein n=1 Tax=Alcanivorax sp. DP30 TaxID=2606217 RepID=UPI00136CFABE|nr:2Fe-2S iron-sulfur cluster-binding protein [Alcanivorax sp. DP30]MZR62656.1 2Fe-2S iron-sulfur cluster binding domain-containing protein [Alcanivorax sp. DP30]
MTTFTITVNGKDTFPCRAEQKIIEAGQQAGFSFPTACRNGNCLRCEGGLTSGHVLQKNHTIHAGDAGSTQVLYCVAYPLSDCEISVTDVTAPGELPVHTLNCQIVRIESLNHDVSRAWLQLPAGKRIHWHAGQYLMLNLHGECYPFSIANACQGRQIELHIRHGDDNSAAQDIMASLNSDSTVSVTLPAGIRFIDQAPDQPVWFICGSTGFAPVKAMIERLVALDFQQPVRLFWGARTTQDLYLPDLPGQWTEELKDFEGTTALSDMQHPDHQQGLVHEAALAALSEPHLPLFFLGGSPPMAWAVFDALVEEGVPANNIHCDVFDYAPRD